MSTSHEHQVQPDSMAGGFNRLLIIAALAGVAALCWYFGGNKLRHESNGEGHGEGHAVVTTLHSANS